MFYIYMIIGTIISLFLVAIVYFVPFLIVREFDKMTFIKGYKKEKKWLKVLKYITIIITFIILLLGLNIFLIIIIIIRFRNKNERKLMYKQAADVLRVMILSPIVGIGLTFLLISLINNILYFLEWGLVASLFDAMHYIVLFIIIPYYLILAIKSTINGFRAENMILKEDYSEFKDENTSKKEWLKRIVNSPRLEEYKENYLKVYKTEEEWKRSEYALINYNWYYKLLFIFLIIGAFSNIILNFVENDILNMNVITLQVAYVTYFLIIIILLNFSFNSKFLSIFINRKIPPLSITKLIPTVIIGVLLINPIWDNTSLLESSIVPYNKLTDDPIGYSYKEYKQGIVDDASTRKDYLEYNTYQRMEYILTYPQYFEDDMESLGYKIEYYISRNKQKVFTFFSKKINNEETNNYLKKDNYNLFISEKGIDLKAENINEDPYIFTINSNNDFYRYNSEEIAKEYEEKHYGSYNGLVDNDIEKIVKEEAIKAIDSVWSEEMKDRGLE